MPPDDPRAADPMLWFRIDSVEPLPAMPSGVEAGAAARGADRLAREALAGPTASSVSLRVGKGRFWLDGDAVICSCPDCGAPMSVRLWLLLADCWNCRTTIELTEDEEREIRDLLDGRSTAIGSPSDRSIERRTPIEVAGLSEGPKVAIGGVVPTARVGPPAVHGRLDTTRALWDGLFRETPAWLISLIAHLILLTVLALCTFDREEVRAMIISATVSRAVREGGDNLMSPPRDEIQFDLPLPSNIDLTNDRERKAMELADKDAKELRIDPTVDNPRLPHLQDVKRRLGETGDIRAALAARDPRIRVDMVTREGGTTLTEAAVSRGLRWLAIQQQDDGGWNLRGYDGQRGIESRSSATGMALLAFLGAGQTHLMGRYEAEVSRGVRWLIDHQADDGDLRADSDQQAGMYAHGQAAIALCEAYALTGDEQLRQPAQRAIQFIVAAQYSDGGWRYTPQEPPSDGGGDTSVIGWQLMALQSARAARLAVPDHTLELAGQFLDRVESQGGARYAYRPGQNPTPTMTAEALLCRMYLGWQRGAGGMNEAVEYLASENSPQPGNWNIYYWYYGTQALHHYGGKPWTDWNTRMRDLLVLSQETKGHHAGSWPPRGPFADVGGRLYVTSLAVCTMEVYYRHLPLFRPINLEE